MWSKRGPLLVMWLLVVPASGAALRLGAHDGRCWAQASPASGPTPGSASGPTPGPTSSQPLRVERFAETEAPERPRLVLSTAGEVLQELTLKLLSGPSESAPTAAAGKGKKASAAESSEQTLRFPELRPGSPITIPLGKGQPGRSLWYGQALYHIGGRRFSLIMRFETVVRVPGGASAGQPGRVVYDFSHLNLAERYVEVQLVGGGATRGEITAVGEDGADIGSGSTTFSGAQQAPGAWLRLAWAPRPGREAVRVLRLQVVLGDRGGAPVRVTLVPWSVSVPHEEVTFATGRWDIAAAERGKLDHSYEKILAILAQVRDKGISPRLYVTGHTDTVGGDSYNLGLSQHRAHAIASYLLQRGLSIPVLYAGAGERAPRVPTADHYDEPQNRRADYVLSAGQPPLPPGVRWVALTDSSHPAGTP